MIYKRVREVIKLELVKVHAIKEFPILRVRALLPDLFTSAGLAIDQEHGFIPSPLNLVRNVVLARIDITIDLKLVWFWPSALVKFNLHILIIWTGHVPDITKVLSIDIRRPNDQIMYTQKRLLEKEAFFVRFHLNIFREDVGKNKASCLKLHLRLKIHFSCIAWITDHYVGTNWRVMRNLLSEEFIFTWLLKFEGLSQ